MNIVELHGLSRFSSGSTRANVGVPEGSTATNIISDFVLLECRATTYADIEENLEQRVNRL